MESDELDPHEYRIQLDDEELQLFKDNKVKSILEVCPGDGKNLEAFRKKGYEVKRLENAYEKFPFEDDSFDCIYSYQYLNHNYKDKIEEAFKEIFRVLKENGIFSLKITDIEQFNLKYVKDDIYEEKDEEHLQIQYKKLADQTFAKLSSKEKGIPHYGFKKDELVESLEKIGFEIINIRTIRWNLVANCRKVSE